MLYLSSKLYKNLGGEEDKIILLKEERSKVFETLF
jgi:hypothetical protein